MKVHDVGDMEFGDGRKGPGVLLSGTKGEVADVGRWLYAEVEVAFAPAACQHMGNTVTVSCDYEGYRATRVYDSGDYDEGSGMSKADLLEFLERHLPDHPE